MKVCCVFSLESPHRGDSNEYAQHAIINIKKKITLIYPIYNNVCCYGIFFRGLKNEFETAVVNEPSVFEPLKFYCSFVIKGSKQGVTSCPPFKTRKHIAVHQYT